MQPAEVYPSLESCEQGLSDQEAQRRLKTCGLNELPTHRLSTIQVVFRQLKNPLFVILVACAVIAGLYSELKQAIIILAMIALSVVLGFYNEYKAEKIVENLRNNVSIKAVVTRDGKACQIDSKLLVPGDLVTVYVGDISPSD
jgi:magnesium-transporting ATPase (P-type)